MKLHDSAVTPNESREKFVSFASFLLLSRLRLVHNVLGLLGVNSSRLSPVVENVLFFRALLLRGDM